MAKLLSWLVVLLASQLVSSVPTSNQPTSRTPVLQQIHDLSISPFRYVRDAVIEGIWGTPCGRKLKPYGRGRSRAPTNYRTRYGDDVVLRFQFDTQEEIEALSDAIDVLYLDVWDITNEWVDIRLSNSVVTSLLGLLPQSMGQKYTPVIYDLAKAVYDTYPGAETSHNERPLHPIDDQAVSPVEVNDIFFNEYQPLSVLYPWLRLLASMFPTHVTLESIGLSAEGRDIPALRLGARVDLPPDHEHPTRMTILVTGGLHAREWISVSTAAYIAYNLVTRYGDPRFHDTTKLLNHFDVVFIPTMNPDGYEYTWTTDRLWRKNRQHTSLPFCSGIDLDRAFPFAWDGHDEIDNPCAEDFAGSKPFEAYESQRLADWAKNQTLNNNVTFVSFLDLHSYSQQVLYPYSFSCDSDPPNLEDLEEVAIGLAKSFRLTNGRFYSVNSACEGSTAIDYNHENEPTRKGPRPRFPRGSMESSGGSALDYFYHELRVKYSYQIKLRDMGAYGFLLPKEHILPTGAEAFEAVLGLGRWLLGNHGIERSEL
ncbi:putative metallocarboxypeptidase ECM14 [Cyphellophora attinorum]|uniref:Inactive metallocarboxypeptidase ECM14 n=1 Tax=Cyphellophora attinorum TaxID=1664694 RepID=A0A0N1H292_9EURO|nr:putative metallocarboxypeptidase ECM14 [Phialophora attinorum]KPI34334.1 putative metallocarboxypeptidase ECM14 [Phialophora attinorum]